MFPATKPKVVAAPKQPKPSKQKKKQIAVQSSTDPFHVTVEPEWMAQYWEEEAAWQYYVPEDNFIKFKDGKYIVPIVVYRHFEDMRATSKRKLVD